MNLPDAFPYKGFLIRLESEPDYEFHDSFDFGDEAANEEYRALYRAGELVNVHVSVRRFDNGDEAGKVIASLGGVHLLNDGTVRAQVRTMIDGGELMTPDGDSFTVTPDGAVTP